MNCLFKSAGRNEPGRARLFAALVAGVLITASSAGAQTRLMVKDTIAERVLACAACHGENGRATRDGYFPRIAGKPAGYLYNQLLNFRDGRRQNPMMGYVVGHLSDDYLAEIARHFAGQHLPYPSPQPPQATPHELERGRRLVYNGDSGRNIPACAACHGRALTGVSPAIPGLLGLSRDYLNAQFGAWKTGARKAAAPDCMAHISQRLSPQDIGAVSAWLAAQSVPDDMVVATAGSVQLPLKCGSVPQ